MRVYVLDDWLLIVVELYKGGRVGVLVDLSTEVIVQLFVRAHTYVDRPSMCFEPIGQFGRSHSYLIILRSLN